MRQEKKNGFLSLLQGLEAIVRYQGDLGVGGYYLPDDFSQPVSVPQQGMRKRAAIKGERLGVACPAQPDDTLASIARGIETCAICQEADGQCLRVYGCGPRDASLFVLLGDEHAGKKNGLSTFLNDEEDRLLTKMLQAIDLSRQEVFVAGLSKCYTEDGISIGTDQCMPFLIRQLAVIRPRILCVMGGRAARMLLQTDRPLSSVRGRFSRFQGLPHAGIRVIATYHPHLLLQHEEMKRASWEDLKMIKKELSRHPSAGVT